MHSSKNTITPYSEINELIKRLLKDVKRILKEKFIGMYIFGSLAINDFTPGRSDVDFLVVTSEKISEETFDDLKKMHAKLTASKMKWADILEGSYIPKEAIRSYDPDNSYHPSLRYDGHFDLEKHSADWIIVFHTIREYSIVVEGPDPKSLIDPVESRKLKKAILDNLDDYWYMQIQNPVKLKKRDYQSFATLTMARMLYTLKYGSVVSKTKAAIWAMDNLDKKWKKLIKNALAWPNLPQKDEFTKTAEFIKFTMEQSKNI